MPFDVRVVCPACRVEGARVEAWEPGAASPASHRCRLCGASAEHGAPEAPTRLPTTLAELDRALGAWAVEEGLASAGELVEAYFVLPTGAEILAAMARGELVETTFDVVDYLFSSGGGTGGATAVETTVVRPDVAPPSFRPAPASLRRVGGPRDELLALAAVAASDGDASADDQEVLRRAAEQRGIPPLAAEDIHVRRPAEIDPPATLVQREALLKEMFWMAWSDGELDESELRVVRAFARAWGVDPQRVQEWTDIATYGDSNRLERWVTRIGRFLFPAW
jgi:hypothetical protein